METCRSCGTQFQKPKGRGRPPVRCEPCRGIKPQTPELPAAPVIKLKSKNGLYSRDSMVKYLENHPPPFGAQEIARVIREELN